MDQLKEVEVTAERIYGRPYSMLTDEEKDALATAFGTRRETLEGMFEAAYSQLPTESAQMLKTGNLAHANWGGALGNVARTAAAAYGMRNARQGMDELSNTEQIARSAASDVAANSAGKQQQMMADMIRNMRPQQSAPPASQQPPTPPPTPQAPPPQAQAPAPAPSPAPQQAPGPRPPMMAAGNQINADMASRMQGSGPTSNGVAPPPPNAMPPGNPPMTPAQIKRMKEEEMVRRLRGW